MVRSRVVFLGTPEFAVPSLERLLNSPDVEVVAVITQPDRPAGRGMKLTPPPIKILAELQGIPLLQPERLKGNDEVLAFLDACEPDLGVVAAFGQLLPRTVFARPLHGMLNVHGSLLPHYRGAAPVTYAIWNGERETGVTIMKIDEGLDSGDTLTSRSCQIGPNLTGGELSLQLAELGAGLLLETIPGYLSGEIVPEPQEHSAATYAPRIRKEQARIDWQEPSERVHNQIRAFHPAPGAYCLFRDLRLKVLESRIEEVAVDEKAGRVLRVTSDGISVCCGTGTSVLIRQVQAAGRKRVSAGDFARGSDLHPGEFLS